jgi:hypothetical protein
VGKDACGGQLKPTISNGGVQYISVPRQTIQDSAGDWTNNLISKINLINNKLLC